MLLRALDGALAMASAAMSTSSTPGRPLQAASAVERDVIELDTDALRTDGIGQAEQRLDGVEIVVPAPVRVDDGIAMGPAPGLAAVDAGGNRGALSGVTRKPYLRPK
jgi:hypothetical protein